jgi:prevent-host-death family protein
MSEPSSNDHTVGARDLTHGTGRILARVRAGETLTITERGEPIAMVVPPRQPRVAMPAVGYATSGDPARGVPRAGISMDSADPWAPV